MRLSDPASPDRARTDDASPKMPRRSLRNRMRRSVRVGLAALFLAPLLSLSMIVAGPVGQANAYATVGPVTLTAGQIRGAATVLRLGGVAAATGGVGLGVVGVGMLAYATKDSWMPLVNNAFNGFQVQPSVKNGQSGCTMNSTFSPAFHTEMDSRVNMTVTHPSGCHGVVSFTSESICQTPAGVAYKHVLNSSFTTVYQGAGYPVTRPMDVCAATADILKRMTVTASNFAVFVGTMIQRAIPDSLFKQRAEVRCKRPDGSVFDLIDTITGQPDRLYMPSCEAADPGSRPLWADFYTGIGDALSKVLDIVEVEDPTIKYPDCYGAGGALLCNVKVHVDGNPCVVGQEGPCTEWADIVKTQPDRVECKYGSYVIPMKYCEPLTHVYPPGVKPEVEITDPEAPPRPEVQPPTNPTPTPTPTPTGPAEPTPTPTGEPTPNPTPTGSAPNPSAPPTSGPNPPNPPTDPNPETDPDSPSCFGAMWSWNPVDWVLVPVKCALLWAFKPPDGYLEEKFGGVRADWSATTPALWATEIGNMVPGGASGCNGVQVTIPLPGYTISERMGSACDGTMATTAGLVRAVLSASVIVAGAFGCLRAVGSGLGWSPGIGNKGTV